MGRVVAGVMGEGFGPVEGVWDGGSGGFAGGWSRRMGRLAVVVVVVGLGGGGSLVVFHSQPIVGDFGWLWVVVSGFRWLTTLRNWLDWGKPLLARELGDEIPEEPSRQAVRRPPVLTGVIYPDFPAVVFYLEACGTSFCCGASLLCGTDLAMLTFLALDLALR